MKLIAEGFYQDVLISSALFSCSGSGCLHVPLRDNYWIFFFWQQPGKTDPLCGQNEMLLSPISQPSSICAKNIMQLVSLKEHYTYIYIQYSANWTTFSNILNSDMLY